MSKNPCIEDHVLFHEELRQVKSGAYFLVRRGTRLAVTEMGLIKMSQTNGPTNGGAVWT